MARPEHDGSGSRVLRNRQDVWNVLEGGGVVVDVRYGNNDGNGSPTARTHRSARDLKDNCGKVVLVPVQRNGQSDLLAVKLEHAGLSKLLIGWYNLQFNLSGARITGNREI